MKRSILKSVTLFTLTAVVMSIGCTKGQKNAGDIVVVMKQQEGQPLAQVGKTMLSVEAMREDFLQRQGQFRGADNLNTEQARTSYIENQVLQKAMFLDAIEQGYFSRPDVLRDIEKIVVQKLMRDKLEKAQNDFVPTDEQIKQHFEKHQNLYNREEALKVAYIALPMGDKKEKAKELALQMHKEAMETAQSGNTKAFARLASKYAEKLTALGKVSVETNETSYLEKLPFENKFGANVFLTMNNSESMGKVAPLVTTDKGFFIMMKTGYRKALNETLKDAQPKIVKRLAYESRGDVYKNYTDDLKKKYDIKIFNELVAQLSKDTEPPKGAKKEGGAGMPLNQAMQNAQAQAQAHAEQNEQAEAETP